mmetsp:Transcript_65663/g.186317  ORF Transcript_65663/g.186317 Transcript_65663/m.186317 type:complete len:290 (+) Transcript_65663:994-1863(+)
MLAMGKAAGVALNAPAVREVPAEPRLKLVLRFCHPSTGRGLLRLAVPTRRSTSSCLLLLPRAHRFDHKGRWKLLHGLALMEQLPHEVEGLLGLQLLHELHRRLVDAHPLDLELLHGEPHLLEQHLITLEPRRGLRSVAKSPHSVHVLVFHRRAGGFLRLLAGTRVHMHIEQASMRFVVQLLGDKSRGVAVVPVCGQQDLEHLGGSPCWRGVQQLHGPLVEGHTPGRQLFQELRQGQTAQTRNRLAVQRVHGPWDWLGVQHAHGLGHVRRGVPHIRSLMQHLLKDRQHVF